MDFKTRVHAAIETKHQEIEEIEANKLQTIFDNLVKDIEEKEHDLITILVQLSTEKDKKKLPSKLAEIKPEFNVDSIKHLPLHKSVDKKNYLSSFWKLFKNIFTQFKNEFNSNIHNFKQNQS